MLLHMSIFYFAQQCFGFHVYVCWFASNFDLVSFCVDALTRLWVKVHLWMHNACANLPHHSLEHVTPEHMPVTSRRTLFVLRTLKCPLWLMWASAEIEVMCVNLCILDWLADGGTSVTDNWGNFAGRTLLQSRIMLRCWCSYCLSTGKS